MLEDIYKLRTLLGPEKGCGTSERQEVILLGGFKVIQGSCRPKERPELKNNIPDLKGIKGS